jgi:hypothetical protein
MKRPPWIACGLSLVFFWNLLMSRDALRRLLTALPMLCLSSLVLADEPAVELKPEPTPYMRIVNTEEGEPQRLETAIVRFQSPDGKGDVVVDLVSVVHVGDKSYYDALNKEFEQYDVVLYELVAPKGTRIPKGGREEAANPIAMLQGMTKSMLELESQMDHIDYTKENFVHADLSPDEMAAAMKERGENGLTLVLGVTADMLRQANLDELRREREGVKIDDTEEDPLALLFDPQRATKLKRQMARAFANPETLDGGLGPTLGRMLVDDRNAAAMKEFQKQLVAGKKKIAIFYGAAHMPDFEERLREDFGMRPVETRWVSAWDLKPGNMGKTADPLDLFKKLLEDVAQ